MVQGSDFMTDMEPSSSPTRRMDLMIDGVLAAAAKYGVLTVLRIYGD